MKLRALILVVTLARLSLEHCAGHDVCRSCPAGWTQWQNNCYRFYNQPRLNFDESEAFCAQFVPFERTCSCKTAHLTTIESSDENNFLHNWWKSMREPLTSVQHVRIGYTDSDRENIWKWIDGSTSSYYTNWDDGQPDNSGGSQNCAVMWKTEESSTGDRGRWDDEGCWNARAFICKIRL